MLSENLIAICKQLACMLQLFLIVGINLCYIHCLPQKDKLYQKDIQNVWDKDNRVAIIRTTSTILATNVSYARSKCFDNCNNTAFIENTASV